MNCEKVDTPTLAAQLKQMAAVHLYQPAPGAAQVLRLKVVLPRPADANAMFALRSNRTGEWLYRGPFVSELTLRFDERLAADNGNDTLRFYLFDAAAGQVCAWFNERGERYWRDGQRVDIELLDEGEFDADNLFKQHQVKISR